MSTVRDAAAQAGTHLRIFRRPTWGSVSSLEIQHMVLYDHSNLLNMYACDCIFTQIYDILNICIIFIYFIVHLGNTLYLMIAIMKLARQSTWWSNLNSDNQSCIHLSCLLLFVGHREQFGIKDQTMRINLSTRPASVHTLFAYMANSTKEYQRYTTGWGPPSYKLVYIPL